MDAARAGDCGTPLRLCVCVRACFMRRRRTLMSSPFAAGEIIRKEAVGKRAPGSILGEGKKTSKYHNMRTKDVKRGKWPPVTKIHTHALAQKQTQHRTSCMYTVHNALFFSIRQTVAYRVGGKRGHLPWAPHERGCRVRNIHFRTTANGTFVRLLQEFYVGLRTRNLI